MTHVHPTPMPHETNRSVASELVPPEFENFQDPRKVFHHLDRVLELQQTGDTRPLHLTLGLTNYCNHKCPWCYINFNQAGRPSERSGAGDRKRRGVNADWRVIEAVGEARAMGLKAVTIVGDGEPTLHPEFPKILKRLGEFGLQIGIFSNLGNRDPEVIEALAAHCFFVRGSIDAATPEAHRVSHGTDDFDQVIANLRALVARRREGRRPAIGVQYVTNQWNYRDLPMAARFYRDLGVDYFTIKPAYKNEQNPAHPENEIDKDEVFALMREAQSASTDTYKVYAKFPQFMEVVGQKYNGARYYKKCNATPLSPCLEANGDLEMCGNVKGLGFTMGNVRQSSFEEIWRSSQRQGCLSRINLQACPTGCRLDPLNKVLWDAFNPDEDKVHQNFI
jgi:radical SAM protein with 4Fe4S-binding SPASM domain